METNGKAKGKRRKNMPRKTKHGERNTVVLRIKYIWLKRKKDTHGKQYSFWDHELQISLRQMNFQYFYFPRYEK